MIITYIVGIFPQWKLGVQHIISLSFLHLNFLHGLNIALKLLMTDCGKGSSVLDVINQAWKILCQTNIGQELYG